MIDLSRRVGREWCCSGHWFANGDRRYVVNPQGGYDQPGLYICGACVNLPWFADIRQRLKETAGFTDEQLSEK